MDLIESILVIVAFVVALKIISVITEKLQAKREKTKKEEWFKYGFLSIKDLYGLEPNEFEEWCADFLRRAGYRNVIVTPDKNDGGKDIICEKSGQKIYVECKRYLHDEKAEFFVTRDIVQKLVGAMVGDRVNKGMIITTGIVTPASHAYVKTLPKDYEVELIDGVELINRFRSLRYEEIDRCLSSYQKRSS